MKYSILFTETAQFDLREIALYLAEESKNKDIARRFIKDLTDQCRQLEDFPLSGAIPKDRLIKSAGYRYLVHKDYLIFYTTDETKSTVYIQAIFNAKKDYTRIMKKFI